MKMRIVLSASVIALLLAACADVGGSPAPSGSPVDRDDGSGVPHPDGNEVVLTVSDEGGFVPVDWTVRSMPAFVLLGDGRVIVQGPQLLIFPGPILPNLQVRTLTDDGMQTLLEEIGETGLFASDLDLRGAMNMIADAPDTVFTLNADDRQVTLRIYALGMVEPGMEVPGMGAAELTAHRTLSQLRDNLLMLDTALPADAWADEWHSFEPEAFRLWVRDASGEPPNPDVGALPVLDWPTDADPAAFGEEDPLLGDGTRCGVVEGAEAEAWLEALSQATELSRLRSADDGLWAVIARPLLPHEERACPEREPG